MTLPAGILGPLMLFVICECGAEFSATGGSDQTMQEFAEWSAAHDMECPALKRDKDSMS